MNSTPTKEEINAAIRATKAVYEAIKEFGPSGVPSGHLYAAIMGQVSLSMYNQIIAVLKRGGMIEESNFILRAK